MRYVAAYLLATLGGNKSPSASDITDILSSVGIDVDPERLDVVINELSGKDIDEVGLWLRSCKCKLQLLDVGFNYFFRLFTALYFLILSFNC